MTNSTNPGKGNSGAPAGFAPVTAGNPTRASSLAIDQSHMEDILAEAGAKSSIVQCRRPPKGFFFTVMREKDATWENRRMFFGLELEGHDLYLVEPEIAQAKIATEEEDTIRPLLLVRYVLMTGDEGLWPLKVNRGEKVNPWNASAHNILTAAETAWVRILSLQGHYRHQVSRKTLEEVPPQFTDRPFMELVDIAFHERMVDANHEIWAKLRDGAVK
jgi:hypothetical protein